MASAVIKQPLSSPKSEKEDSKTVNKILPGEKTLNKMNPDEKNLEKIQPDRGFLRKVSPTSDVLVKLLEGVVINQKVEIAQTGMGMLAAWACFCCKVGCLFRMSS